MNQECGAPSKVIDPLTGEATPSPANLCNEAAHGAPFHSFPRSGLLELIRDLIDYAYRDWPLLEDAAVIGPFEPERSEEWTDTVQC